MAETITTKDAAWLWYPGDFEIHAGLVQNFQREERRMGWPAYWYMDDCHRNVKFSRTYQLDAATTFTVKAIGTGYVAIDDAKHPLGQALQVEAGTHRIEVFVGNLTGLPTIYVIGQVIRSDSGWEASNFLTSAPAGHDPLFTHPDQDPNVITYQTQKVAPTVVTPIDGGVLFDFGRELNGTLQVTTAQPITLCYGESATEARDVARCYYKQDGVTAATKLRRRAFRYIFVPAVAAGSVDLVAVHMFVPKVNRASFHSDNALMNKIWEVSAETLNLCSDVFFIDGVKRDRWIWAGDAYQENFINQYSFFDEDVDKRTILALRGQDDVKQHIDTIVDYSMLWVISILNHYQMTGDVAFLRQIYPRMLSMVKYLMAQTNDLGFIYGRKNDWIFVDWSEMDKTGTVAAEQMLLLEVYKTVVTVATVLDEPVTDFQAKYDQLHANVMQYFWDADRGAFIDSYESGKRHVTRHANIFAILFDVVDQAKMRSILHHVLLNPAITQLTTPYFKFFEQDALCKLGQQARVYQTLSDYWGGMLDRGAVTFWEEFDPEQTGAEMYAMYGDPYGKSLCHGWGASPIYLLGRHFIGLRPTAPGYQTFALTPALDAFDQLNATLPIKDGSVTVVKNGSRLTVTATRAGGSVSVGDKTYPLPAKQAVTMTL
ncbi:alpha-L-rhamnosidase-related protein [Lacticaseibacillus sp. GG6-2]